MVGKVELVTSKEYLTTKEVADLCGVNRATVVRWVQNGDLFAETTIGGRYRICPRNLMTLSKEKGIFLAQDQIKRLNLMQRLGETAVKRGKKKGDEKNPKVAKSNILVIDDDPTFRQLLDEFLTLHGYNVLLADNGYSGLDIILKDYALNLIILDLLMPGINGIETMRQIKVLRKDLPIIITSGFVEYHFPDGTDSLENMADLVLEKPFNLDELYQACKKLLPEQKP